MQLKIHKGRVDLSGVPILTDVTMEINTESRIAVVGRNGCGKTTLIKLIAGDLPLSNTQSDGGFKAVSGRPTIGTLHQMTFADETVSLIEEIRSAYTEILHTKERLDIALAEMERQGTEESIKEYTNLLDLFTNLGGFYFEKEYEAAIKKFGFSEADKYRPVSTFSGGQRTKLAFLKLLLSKPDLLLLDEPTNHLDMEAVMWLEEYLSGYKKAVVIVSHDRMFLDKTVNEVYEIENGKTYHYKGNYTEFTTLKAQRREMEEREYQAQQGEIKRLSDLADRFRYKATKAAMAQSKLKQIDRMEKIEAPVLQDNRTFKGSLSAEFKSVKDVLKVNNLEIGFEKTLSKVSFEVERGERIGVIGGNGLGKSTLLKTLVGKIPALGGDFQWGGNVKIGYFDQQMAQYTGEETVFENFSREYPFYNDFEVRSALGAFLFSGEDVFKSISKLSGGERVRLSLCKLFRLSPNVLILDEPTNHMDILSKETLEEMLLAFDGTLIFVSHDRYFVKKLANKLLCFENGECSWYEYGFDQYLSQHSSEQPDSTPTQASPKKAAKKSFTTPGKEKAKRERAIATLEEKISVLEEELKETEEQLKSEQNASDYLLLQQLTAEYEEKEALLLGLMEEWDSLN